jgi:hypothetical protein
MTIYAVEENVVLGVSLPLAHFSAFAEEHKRRFPNTESVESQGALLVQADFPESAIAPFITAVCNWGGYAGIGKRILIRNTPAALRDGLHEANALLKGPTPDLEGALTRLNRLHSLGSPSFASKHLRFLRPDICPVLDSILRDALPYSFDADGYAAFAADCISIAAMLKRQHAVSPWNGRNGSWFAADVEAALYVHFNGWA